jgi:hypothetical protein
VVFYTDGNNQTHGQLHQRPSSTACPEGGSAEILHEVRRANIAENLVSTYVALVDADDQARAGGSFLGHFIGVFFFPLVVVLFGLRVVGDDGKERGRRGKTQS